MNRRILSLCLTGTFLATSLSGGAEPAGSPIRIVDCDKPVKSRKRGVCLNKVDAKDFMALSPSVSWFYNWHYTDSSKAPAAAEMEFLPMAWGDRPEDLSGLETYLSNHTPRVVLAINEPNLKDQAFITPEKTAALYQKIKAIADKRKIPVVGPHMALGSPDGSSITAVDPITKQRTTYTFMTPFLKAVDHYLGDTPVTAVAAHSYGNFGELKWMVGMMHEEFKRPVWVTEFADWKASGPDAERDYLIQSVDLMERLPYVEGYAWFKERAKDHKVISLLADEPGKLTQLGETYVDMPVHDPLVYYRLPGRLQSESYVRMENADIAVTTDQEGFLEMQILGDNASLEYQIAVPGSGKFLVSGRLMARPGTKIELTSASGTPLAVLEVKAKGWQTVQGELTLPAGNHTLKLKSSGAARLNWIEFANSK